MKATDFRDLNFDRLRRDLNRQRASVYAAWQAHGPGTTRHVAGESGIDLLSLRPRTTELMELGLLAVADRTTRGPRAATASPRPRNGRRGGWGKSRSNYG